MRKRRSSIVTILAAGICVAISAALWWTAGGVDRQEVSSKGAVESVPLPQASVPEATPSSLDDQWASDTRAEDTIATETGDIGVSLSAMLNDPASDSSYEAALSRLRRWVDVDPAASAEWGERLPETDFRRECLALIAITWANRSPNAAADWARGLTHAAERQSALGSVAGELMRNDPSEALILTLELDPGEPRDNLLNRGVAEWAVRAGEESVAWVRGIPDERLRQAMLASAIVQIADRDPVAAAGWAAIDLASGRAQDDAIVAIVQRWAQRDPSEAQRWVSQLDSGMLKMAAEQSLVGILNTQ